MGKIVEFIGTVLVSPEPDRHCNRIQIYRTRGRLVHINIRNVQIRLTPEQFEHWKQGFSRARIKLGDLMSNDTLEPWVDE